MVHLSDEDKAYVTKLYMDRYEKHGINVETLKSGGMAKQHIRHVVQAGMFDLKDKHILDVGCGIGMFYEHLKSINAQIASYTGLDIFDPFLESNRNRFPEASFDKVDIFLDPLNKYTPDIAFMSQVFNTRYKDADNEDVAKEAIRRFFKISKIGIAIDFITSYVDYNEAELHYYSPEMMFAFAKTLTRNVALRHDYLPFEFSLFLFKQPTFDLNEISESINVIR